MLALLASNRVSCGVQQAIEQVLIGRQIHVAVVFDIKAIFVQLLQTSSNARCVLL